MKITVGIPSRGRPLDLIGAILSLDKLKSHGHDIEYLLSTDDDDPATDRTVHDLMRHGLPIRRLTNAGRPMGLGELHNQMAAATPPDATFLLFSDRCIAITEGWDHQIATAAMMYPHRVLWMDSIHLLGAGQFILPPAWRSAAPDGKVCPGYFPFWFEDSAVEEVDAFVHGFPRMAIAAKCAGPRTQKTNRMRDLEFWIRFYAALRPSRLAEAQVIADKLGLPRRDNTELVAFWEKRDADFLSREPELRERFGDDNRPGPAYLAAKANARMMMTEMGHDPDATHVRDVLAELRDRKNVAEVMCE